MSKARVYVAVFILSGGFMNCSEFEIDEFDRSSQGEFAIPLGQGSFKVKDFFQMPEEMDQLIVDENGHLSIKYQSERIEVEPSVLLPSIPFGLPIPIEDTSVSIDLPRLNGLTINKAELDGDQLTFSFLSPHPEDLTIFVTSNSFLQDGRPFSVSFQLPFSDVLPNVLITEPISLDGYMLNAPNQKLELRYRAENQDGEFRPLSSAIFTISAIEFKSFQGKVEQTSIPLPSGFVVIDFFDPWDDGKFFIKSPVIQVDIGNSFSLPIGVILQEVIVTTKTGEELVLTSDIVQQVIHLNYPDLSEQGDTMLTSFKLDDSNSNIEEIFAALPNKISYTFTGIINPENSGETFGLDKANTLNGSASVTLPLDGYADNAVITDTFIVSLAEVPDIQEAELSWVTENSMPVSISVQFELLDDLDQSLGLFFPGLEPVIQAAEVGEGGLVTSSTRYVSKIPLSGTIIEKLNLTSKIVVLASFTTFEQNKRVIFTNEQSLDIYLGLKFRKGD